LTDAEVDKPHYLPVQVGANAGAGPDHRFHIPFRGGLSLGKRLFPILQLPYVFIFQTRDNIPDHHGMLGFLPFPKFRFIKDPQKRFIAVQMPHFTQSFFKNYPLGTGISYSVAVAMVKVPADPAAFSPI